MREQTLRSEIVQMNRVKTFLTSESKGFTKEFLVDFQEVTEEYELTILSMEDILNQMNNQLETLEKGCK